MRKELQEFRHNRGKESHVLDASTPAQEGRPAMTLRVWQAKVLGWDLGLESGPWQAQGMEDLTEWSTAGSGLGKGEGKKHF